METPPYMTIIQKKLNERKMQNTPPKRKKQVHVIPDERPREGRKSPRLHQLPPPRPYPITIPTPKEFTSMPHYIPPDLPQL
eukprot:4392024-Ditylum_brightwellii.AAC.1